MSFVAAVTDYATYEEFLDSQISPVDLYYLQDEELARRLVELGYRGSGEVGTTEKNEEKKSSDDCVQVEGLKKEENEEEEWKKKKQKKTKKKKK